MTEDAFYAKSIPEEDAILQTTTRNVTPVSDPKSGDDKPKPLRRRARRACLSCRSRKVRCDVTHRVPCGNCSWDHIECVVVSRRGKRNHQVYPTSRFPAKEHGMKHAERTEATCLEPKTTTLMPSPILPKPIQTNEPMSPPKREDIPVTEQGSDPSQTLATCEESEGFPSPPDTSTTSKLRHDQYYLSCLTPEPSQSLSFPEFPPFLQPIATRVPVDDMVYLYAKGALAIPTPELQDALLRAFFDHAHPHLPVLDIDRFLEALVRHDGTSSRISILLFQAVMFAGAATVDMEYLRKAGFQSRRQARDKFFQRVVLIYDFNCEPDRIILVQALLLMSLWYDTPDDHRNAWYWIDVAISQAFAAGLHIYNLASSLTPRDKSLRRQIWQCCFVRDRLVSLAMRRPPRIKTEEFYVSEGGAEIVSTPIVPKNRRKAYETKCSYFFDFEKRLRYLQLFTAEVNLCRCLEYSLGCYYSAFLENSEAEDSEATIDSSQDTPAYMASSRNLQKWYISLLECCRVDLRSTIDIGGIVGKDVGVHVFRIMLDMIFNSMVLSLNRHRLMTLLKDPMAWPLELRTTKLRMQHTARRISDLAGHLQTYNLIRLLPSTAITVMVSSAAVHLLEVKGQLKGDKIQALEGYRRCMWTLHLLQEMYRAADIAKSALERAFIEPITNSDCRLQFDAEGLATPSVELLHQDVLSISETQLTAAESVASSIVDATQNQEELSDRIDNIAEPYVVDMAIDDWEEYLVEEPGFLDESGKLPSD